MASIGSTNYNFFTGVSFGSVLELQEIVDTEGWEAMYDMQSFRTTNRVKLHF